MYFSFDIFDTCLIRSCGFAHNVFDLLAIRILGENSTESSRADFVNIRISGEETARNKKNTEVTLKDIYNVCDFSGLTNITNQEIAQAEMLIEKEVLVGVISIKKQIDILHKKGYKIYYISDMYLPETFLKEVLTEQGFWKNGDKLYISCISGKTKSKGDLFDFVAQENNINFKQWHHWGDNEQSDYKIPQKKGIHAHLIKHRFSNYEQQILKQDLFPGIYINQQLAGIQKATRLSFDSLPQLNLGVNITIPLLVSFVFQILEDAKQSNIKHLFFLARDGFLPFFIAKQIQPHYPSINLQYIYTSRSALYFPGTKSAEYNDIKEVLGKLTGKKLKELFIDRTNIDISEYISDELSCKIICSEKEGEELLIKLYQNEAFKNKISLEYIIQKGLVTKYFIQTGLASKSKDCAICDIRGTRKCHKIINQILFNAGFSQVKGYYLEVTSDRVSMHKGDYYFSIFYSERYKNTHSSLRYLNSLYAVIEQYFCATGSQRTIKYTENKDGIIIPVYEEKSEYKYGKELCNLHQEIAKRYIKHYINNKLFLYNKELQIYIYNNLYRFAQYPYKTDLQPLTKVRVNDDKFHYSTLVHKYPLINILKKDMGINEWPRGSLVYTIYSYLGEKLGRTLLTYIKK